MKKKFNIVPIKRVDVYSTVISRIRSLIEVNNLKPGAKLPSERDLADQLEVSRTSIRQAIKALETLGEVEIKRGSGTYVCEPKADIHLRDHLINHMEFSKEFLQYLSEGRAAIECKIVEIAIEKGTKDDWVRMKNFLLNESKTEEEDEIGSLDLGFEKELSTIAGNPILILLQNIVHNSWIFAWGKMGITPDYKTNLVKEHSQILEAMIEGNSELAIDLMKQHVDRLIL